MPLTIFSYKSLRIFTALLVLGPIIASCSKQDATKTQTEAEPNYTSLWDNVFSNRCGTCHGIDSNSNTLGGPDLRTKDSFYSALVGKQGSDYPSWDTFQTTRSDCLDSYFIKSGSAATSLVTAILDPSVKPCTVKSHLTAPQNIAISTTSLTSLKTWIDNGASQ